MLTAYLASTARLSRDSRYRYALTRRLAYGPRTVLFVGLNPSTADATRDDPTIRRCVGFARAWGFDELVMANLHAWRSADPRTLAHVPDPVGPANVRTVMKLAADARLVVAAWGVYPLNDGRAVAVALELAKLDKTFCLGLTQFGHPRHPLYVRKDAALVRYTR